MIANALPTKLADKQDAGCSAGTRRLCGIISYVPLVTLCSISLVAMPKLSDDTNASTGKGKSTMVWRLGTWILTIACVATISRRAASQRIKASPAASGNIGGNYASRPGLAANG